MAEMKIFVKELKRTITSRETGSNKQSASKSCALSLVRQMFHLKVIEAYSGTIKVKQSEDQIASYPVRISPEIKTRLEDCLNDLEIRPVSLHNNVKTESQDESGNILSLLVHNIFAL